jgi:hypothetical protein
MRLAVASQLQVVSSVSDGTNSSNVAPHSVQKNSRNLSIVITVYPFATETALYRDMPLAELLAGLQLVSLSL